jgi:hypothetical protein
MTYVKKHTVESSSDPNVDLTLRVGVAGIETLVFNSGLYVFDDSQAIGSKWVELKTTSTNSAQFTQNAHGFNQFDVVKIENGIATLATSFTDDSVGSFIVTDIVDINTINVGRGYILSPAHGFDIGDKYYLQEDGTLAKTPSFYQSVEVFTVINSDVLLSGNIIAIKSNNIIKQIESGRLGLDAATTVTLDVLTYSGSDITIDWGDGTVENIADGALGSHTYSSPYTGDAFITSNCLDINQLIFTGFWYLEIQSFFTDFPRINHIEFNGADVQGYGSLSPFPKSTTFIDGEGGAVTGDITDSFFEGFERIRFTGINEISFDVSKMPSTLSYVGVTGNNYIYGILSNFPSACTHFDVKGNNTISGDLSDVTIPFPPVFNLGGNNTVDTYSSPIDFSLSNMQIFILTGGGDGLSTAEVDQLLIDLSASTWAGSKNLFINGNHAARSAASDAAVTSLGLQGVTVSTN